MHLLRCGGIRRGEQVHDSSCEVGQANNLIGRSVGCLVDLPYCLHVRRALQHARIRGLTFDYKIDRSIRSFMDSLLDREAINGASL